MRKRAGRITHGPGALYDRPMRMAWTIWRYVLAEMWRLLLLATGVLVAFAAFAFAAKPVIEGKVGAWAAIRLVLYAVPPMMQYALPFSACLAAVLAYHRLAADNELTAARAGGLSYRAILMPAAITGAVLTLFMAFMGEWVIPRFLRQMQGAVTQDVAQMITGSIEKGEPLDFGTGVLLHADRATNLGPDAQSGAFAHMHLLNPVALWINQQGVAEGATTARSAWIWLKEGASDAAGRPMTSVEVYLDQAVGSQMGKARASGGLWLRRDISSTLGDNPKFMMYSEIRALPAEPDRYSGVDSIRRDLAIRMARQRVVGDLDKLIRSKDGAVLVGRASRTTIRGGGLQPDGPGWRILPLSTGGVEIEVVPESGSGAVQRIIAQSATIEHEFEEEQARGAISLALTLTNATIRAAGKGPATENPKIIMSGLAPRATPLPELMGRTSAELLAEARASDPQSQGAIPDAAQRLEKRVRSLRQEVTAKVNERWAIAATSIVLVLCGAVSALRLQGRLPLVVYAWCFFPALLAVLSVNIGQQVAIDFGWPGLVALWGGLGLLAAYTVWAYRVVTRH